MKTKWKPLFLYTPVCVNGQNLVYARYNKKTGLFDFKTQKVVRGTYSIEAIKWELDTNKILTDLINGEE